MNNPFVQIDERLQRIEELLSTIKKHPVEIGKAESQKPIYSIRELAAFLGCSVTTAQKLKNSGRIPFRQFGRKIIFDGKEVLEAVRHHGQKYNCKAK